MKKIILLSISFLFLSHINVAQNVIDEDFLDVIAKNAEPLWAQAPPAFAASMIPEKYKKESAVIFGFKRDLSIDKKSKAGFLSKGERSLVFYENIRFKIKLNDRNAVKNFTEFYFRYSDKEDGFSAKVTKKDGITTTISLSEAVKVESVQEVPEFFKSFFDQEVNAANRYYKVAIPDLEPNDILEYVTITKSKLDVRGSGFIEFSPQYELCVKNYPILFNQIAIETDDKSFFKALSKNGAPEFKKEASTNADFFRYVFTDNDRATEKDVNFINAYRQFPFTKFQVTYSNKDDVKGALIGTRGEIKTNFTKEELGLKTYQDFVDYSSIDDVTYSTKLIYDELKKLGAKDWTDKEYIKNLYYRLRNSVLFRTNYWSDKYAAALFSALLSKQEIEHEVIISVSNQIGELKDILFESELRYVIKIGNDLFFNVTDYSNPGDLVESLLASEAYIIANKTKKKYEQVLKPLTLPDAGFANNTSDFAVQVSLLPDMNTLSVSRVSTYKGINKNRNISDALKFTNYMFDDYKNYGGEPPTDKMKDREAEQYEEQVKTIKKEYKEAKPDWVKKMLQNEFSTKVVYKDFSVASDGRSLRKQDLIFTEVFELHNMVRKAGKKYLVNIPGLVGSQLQFKKEERIRKNDIDVDYARALSWVINFKIPDGYTLEGVTELNTNVDNEIGTYKCTASQANSMATIEIKKIYKKATFPKNKWDEMLKFVDAAYNTSFKNLLLRPIK